MPKSTLLITLTFVVLFIESKGQLPQPTYRSSYYAYAGVGWGGQKKAASFGLTVQISKKSALSLAFQGTQKAVVKGTSYIYEYSPVKQKVSTNMAFLYGRVVKQKWGHIMLMAGPSFTWVTDYSIPSDIIAGSYGGVEHQQWGLTLLGTVMPSYKFVGLGVSPFLNINSVYTHGGLTINVALGSVNFKKKISKPVVN